ncbi:MAG TPA: nucleotidyl transferase AbiEii/AbiGii toxin family protein [Bacteroides uniformis]|nr:nucleotidyl transferase AbiEii/AbiGii toxin family protein [Bacteroides uniformis]
MPQLTAKIRHFYDLHHLLKDEECLTYLHSDAFPEDFRSLLEHDRQSFDKPEGWRDRRLEESPLMTDLPQVWGNLQTVGISCHSGPLGCRGKHTSLDGITA